MFARQLLSIASLVLPCSGVAAADGPVDLKITYSLPLNAEFHGFRDYNFNVSSATVQNSHLLFTYQVAPDLLGRENESMTMFGDMAAEGQFFNLFCGRTGSEASCVSAGGLITCSVLFHNVPVNDEQVREYISNKYPNDPRNPERLAASLQFAGNPIGTFQIQISQN